MVHLVAAFLVGLAFSLTGVLAVPLSFIDSTTGEDLGNAFELNATVREELIEHYGDEGQSMIDYFDEMMREMTRQEICRKTLPVRRRRFPKGNHRDWETHRDCLACFNQNSIEPRLFLLRGTPVLTECVSQGQYPLRGLGAYHAFHYVCSLHQCGAPYLPIAYRSDDIGCEGEACKFLMYCSF